MGNLAHCCEQFLRNLELPVRPPVVCSRCNNQIVFDLVENKPAPSGGILFDEKDDSYSIEEPEYLEKVVTINTKEYEIGSDCDPEDPASVQRNILILYLADFPQFSDKRYKNTVFIIRSGQRPKALAKTAIIS